FVAARAQSMSRCRAFWAPGDAAAFLVHPARRDDFGFSLATGPLPQSLRALGPKFGGHNTNFRFEFTIVSPNSRPVDLGPAIVCNVGVWLRKAPCRDMRPSPTTSSAEPPSRAGRFPAVAHLPGRRTRAPSDE